MEDETAQLAWEKEGRYERLSFNLSAQTLVTC